MFFTPNQKTLERHHVDGKKCVLILALLLWPALLQAQGVLDGLVVARDWVIDIVNVIFAIVVVIGLIRVIAKFIKGDPDVATSALGLVLAVAIWGGFVYLQDDIFSFFGAQGTTITNDTGIGGN